MSTALADHAQLDPIALKQPRTPSHTNAESLSQHIPQMSGIAHPRSSAEPLTGGTGPQIVSNASTEGKKNDGASKPVKTRSLDYILRSGLAGGLAGCAVRDNRRLGGSCESEEPLN